MFSVDDLLNKKFETGGRGPDTYDCYGLCIEVCKRAGIFLPDKDSFYNLAARSTAIQKGKEECIELAKPEPYCLVTFSLHPPYITHVGVVLENCTTFIHTSSHKSVCIERLNNLYWRARIDGYFKYPQPASHS